MRKKLNDDRKRNNYIGIKVQAKTKDQLFYISKRDQIPVSTLINQIILNYLENYFKITKLDWNTLTEEEKKGGYD